jgi:fructose-bisphosphate aldolase/2-amino-3,7-dideoxy-D-threo-hept-6-ulosonate synthase
MRSLKNYQKLLITLFCVNKYNFIAVVKKGGTIMDNIGRNIRLKRIFSTQTEKSLIVPMDHGITIGPVEGLVSIAKSTKDVFDGGATSIIIHKGIAREVYKEIKRDKALIIHLNASTSISIDENNKVLVCNVREAIKLGADAVSFHMNIGSDYEAEQLKQLATVVEECSVFGMPVIAMIYVRGRNIENENDFRKIVHVVRVGTELGVDVIKCNYTGDKDTFKTVVDSTSVPILIAGGNRKNNEFDLFKMVYDAISVGAKGISIGRNIFGYERPDIITKVLLKIIDELLEPNFAYELLKESVEKE